MSLHKFGLWNWKLWKWWNLLNIWNYTSERGKLLYWSVFSCYTCVKYGEKNRDSLFLHTRDCTSSKSPLKTSQEKKEVEKDRKRAQAEPKHHHGPQKLDAKVQLELQEFLPGMWHSVLCLEFCNSFSTWALFLGYFTAKLGFKGGGRWVFGGGDGQCHVFTLIINLKSWFVTLLLSLLLLL